MGEGRRVVDNILARGAGGPDFAPGMIPRNVDQSFTR